MKANCAKIHQAQYYLLAYCWQIKLICHFHLCLFLCICFSPSTCFLFLFWLPTATSMLRASGNHLPSCPVAMPLDTDIFYFKPPSWGCQIPVYYTTVHVFLYKNLPNDRIHIIHSHHLNLDSHCLWVFIQCSLCGWWTVWSPIISSWTICWLANPTGINSGSYHIYHWRPVPPWFIAKATTVLGIQPRTCST